MDTSPVSFSSYYRLVRDNRNFRLLWLAQIVSEIGDWLYAIAIYSLLLEFTGSAKSVALAFVLQVLPQIFVAPTAGVLNDRLSRRRVMIFADWTRALIVLGMLLVRTPSLVWFLYILLFLETIMWALFEPGRNALVPSITRESDLIVANSLGSATWSFNLAIGSALGGVVAGLWGRNTVFAVNALSFVVSALLLSRIRAREAHVEALPPFRAGELADFTPVVEGLRYVKGDLRLMVTMLVKCGLGVMGSNWVLLPILGERVFPIKVEGLNPASQGMLGMSVLMGSRGIGALLGPFIGSLWAGASHGRLRRGILYGFLVGAVGYVALSVSSSLLLACTAVVVAHAGGSTVWVFSTTILQSQTEDRFRGRVFSTEFAFHMLTLSTVTYASGVLIDLGVSVYTLALLTGVGILIPTLGWGWALKLWGSVPDDRD